jgi:tetratricopeptide (TPR) repeat protein
MPTPEAHNTVLPHEWTLKDYLISGQTLSVGPGFRRFAGRNSQQQVFAFKLFEPDPHSPLGRETQMGVFRREAELHLFLKHPRILSAYELIESGGVLCLVTAAPPPMTLACRFEQALRLTLLESLHLMLQLCQALHYLHEQGVVHGGIVPEALVWSEQQNLLLTDFSAARQVFSPPLATPPPSAEALPYLSPEQLKGTEETDYRSDLFSAGVIFYRLLTGKLPFVGTERATEMVSPCQHNSWLPEVLEPLLRKILNPDRDYRMSTARQLAREIETLLDDPDICFAEGHVRHALLGEHEAGRTYCQLALQKDPGHLPSLEMLGLIYLEQQQPELARRCFERLLELQPEQASIAAALGRIERQEGYPEAALTLLEQACRLEPDHRLYRLELAGVLHQLNRHYEALAHYQQLIQSWPEWEPPWREAGHLYYLAGHKEVALEHFRKAHELDPGSFPARYQLALICHELGHYSEARHFYELLLARQPDLTEIHHNLANLCYQIGEMSEAHQILSNLLTRNQWPHEPVWEISYRLLGFVTSRLNQPTQAIEAFKHAILCRPDVLETYLNLAYAYREALRLEDAVQTLRYVAGLNVGQNEASVYFLLARAYYEQGKLPLAIQALEHCLVCTHTLTPVLAQQVQQDLHFLRNRQPVPTTETPSRSVLFFQNLRRNQIS